MKKILLLSIMIIRMVVSAQTYTISSLSGLGTQAYSGDGGLATSAAVNAPRAVAVDVAGNVYVADTYNHRIRKINTNGIITTIAGNGITGFSGDGGPATTAQLHGPWGIAVDAAGNIFIADRYNQRIRKINTNGIISTIAGNGVAGFSGDGGLATAAQFNDPFDVAVDAAGNVFIADNLNCRIRKVSVNGNISTIAGTGAGGFSGDGGPATSAALNFPWGLTVDQNGNVLIADNTNARVRKINTSGIISTIAGTGGSGTTGDGGQATAAQIGYICSIGIDLLGNYYVADANNNRIRKISSSGIISTVAGSTAGFSGDGGLSTLGLLNSPRGLAVDAIGNIYIADSWNSRVRKLTAACSAINIVSTSGSVCPGQTYTATVSGASSYSVNGVAATVYTFSPVNTATYAISGQQLGCSTNTVITTVTIKNSPIITATSGSLCAGSVYTMNLSGADSYSLNGVASTFTFNPANTTTYAVTGSSLGCQSSNTVAATVSVVPVPLISASSGTVCLGTIFTLLVAGASSYSINNLPAVSFTINPSNTSTYVVHGESLGCVSAGLVATVSVKPLPSIIIQNPQTICKYETAVLAATGANSYTWNTNQNSPNISVTPTISTSYTVIGIDDNSCSAKAIVTVLVNQCTGIEDNTREKMNLTVYPNPGNGQLLVNSSNAGHLVIVNTIGQVVYENSINDNHPVSVSLNNYPAGVYFLTVRGIENYKVLKYVKE